MRIINGRAAGVTAAVAAAGLAGGGVAFAHGDFGHHGGRVLHGQFVVDKGDGATATQDVQNGTVTANSAKSLTVKSRDGFTQSYAITNHTRVRAERGYGYGDDAVRMIHNGDKVSVVAVENGGAPDAVGISDFGDRHFRHASRHFHHHR